MSLKNRIQHNVLTVGRAIMPVEENVHLAAAEAHRAVATMIEERQKVHAAGAQADFGDAAITEASAGAHHLTEAANCFGRSHQALAGLLAELGFGPQCPIGRLVSVNAA